MANIFLDASVFFDIREKRTALFQRDFSNDFLFMSILTLDIYFYTFKKKMPDLTFVGLTNFVQILNFTQDLALKALEGPTKDFEDNVQLHSAIDADCNIFYTRDNGLLKLGYFGNVKIQKPTVQF